MKTARMTALGMALSLTAVSLAYGHHSFAMFDQTKQVSMTGTVKEFQFTNPHSWVQLVVTPEAGAAQEWAIEALSPNVLVRSGWKKNSLKPGDKVTVLINPLRDGSFGGNLITITLPSGVVMGGGASSGGGPAPERRP
jgi:Family of unknown function (DUF6152)